VNAEQALYGVFFVKGAPAQRIFFSFIGFLFDLTAGSSSRRALCSRRRAQGRQDWPSRRSFRCSALASPYLDGSEHDGTLDAIGMTIRGELAIGARIIAPQPCIR